MAVMPPSSYSFLKGHGTQNDFVLLPDPDGTVHGALSDDEMAERVRRLCDRRAGIGADGVLRVVRQSDTWFMDYRNADGSIAEMCGNGTRVFVRYLVDEGLVDASAPVDIRTRDGVKTLTVDGQLITVDLGRPHLVSRGEVSLGGVTWPSVNIDMGNPHAVVFVDDEDTLRGLDLTRPPELDAPTHPNGANVEFVVRLGPAHLAMRVHERGAGETRSCGTGAGAALVATVVAFALPRPTTCRVDVAGGTLSLTWAANDHVLLTGPAVVVASGLTSL
jgi:diaminopimelate epimerase